MNTNKSQAEQLPQDAVMQSVLKLSKIINKLEDKSFKKYTGKEKNADYFLEMGKCSAFGTADELIKEYFSQSNDFLTDIFKNLILLEYKRNKKHYLEKEEITIGFKNNKLAFFDGNLRFISFVN